MTLWTALCALLLAAACQAGAASQVVQYVLMGATSNLASKYLYQAWYDTQLALSGSAEIALYACARDSYEKRQPRIASTVRRVVTCSSGTSSAGMPCSATALDAFVANITYVSLADPASNVWAPAGSSDAFSALVRKLDDDAAAATHVVARVIFMSVAPALYAPLLTNLTRAGLLIDGTAGDALRHRTRVVLEKPIGHDQPSAEALLMQLTVAAGIPASSTLIMDHYLAKTGVTAAAQLRSVMSHQGWDELLSSAMHANVVVMERETAATRTMTYNDLGVVRDVMQNHMSVMLAAAKREAASDVWDAAERLHIYSRVNFHASMMMQMEGQGAGMVAGLSPSHSLSARSRVPRDRMSNTPALLTPAIRSRVYDGYVQEVRAEREAADPRNATYAGLRYTWSAMPGCTPMARLDPRSFALDAGGTRSPTPSQMLGPSYVAPTAAAATGMFGRGSVTFIAGKAMDTRAAYVTEYFPSTESSCGPVTITNHVQGLLQLPVGVPLRPASPVRAVWPSDGAAVLFTGTCNMPDGHGLFRAWPVRGWRWDTVYDAVAHVLLALPTVAPLRGDTAGDATQRALSLLAAGAAMPGASGRAAYKAVLMAAASEQPHALFVTPDEVRMLWRIFHQVSDACDFSLSQRCPGDAPKTYAVGDRAWLPIPITPRMDGQQSAPGVVSWPVVADSLVTAVWRVIQSQDEEAARTVNVGLCHESSMVGLLDALSEAAVVISTPWTRIHLWMAANSAMSRGPAFKEALLTRLFVEDEALHGVRGDETASSLNADVHAAGGQLDVLVLTPACASEIVHRRHDDARVYAAVDEAAGTWSITASAVTRAAHVVFVMPPSTTLGIVADGQIQAESEAHVAALQAMLGADRLHVLSLASAETGAQLQ